MVIEAPTASFQRYVTPYCNPYPFLPSLIHPVDPDALRKGQFTLQSPFIPTAFYQNNQRQHGYGINHGNSVFHVVPQPEYLRQSGIPRMSVIASTRKPDTDITWHCSTNSTNATPIPLEIEGNSGLIATQDSSDEGISALSILAAAAVERQTQEIQIPMEITRANSSSSYRSENGRSARAIKRSSTTSQNELPIAKRMGAPVSTVSDYEGATSKKPLHMQSRKASVQVWNELTENTQRKILEWIKDDADKMTYEIPREKKKTILEKIIREFRQDKRRFTMSTMHFLSDKVTADLKK